MRTIVVHDPPPPEFEAMLERRRRIGADHHDEVWEGVLHMAPAPSHEHGRLVGDLIYLLRPSADAAGLELTAEINLGESEEDYRVPDLAMHRAGAAAMWHPTAALAVEVRSPGDDTFEKLPFYAAHGVDELVIIDPATRTVQWLALGDGGYRPVERSGLLELGPVELAGRIDWPA